MCLLVFLPLCTFVLNSWNSGACKYTSYYTRRLLRVRESAPLLIFVNELKLLALQWRRLGSQLISEIESEVCMRLVRGWRMKYRGTIRKYSSLLFGRVVKVLCVATFLRILRSIWFSRALLITMRVIMAKFERFKHCCNATEYWTIPANRGAEEKL